MVNRSALITLLPGVIALLSHMCLVISEWYKRSVNYTVGIWFVISVGDKIVEKRKYILNQHVGHCHCHFHCLRFAHKVGSSTYLKNKTQ